MKILITGATSGIGKSIAEYLCNDGHQIIGCGRRVEDKLYDCGISWLKMDVTDKESVDKAIDKAISFLEEIDVVIQCAGRGAIGPVEAFSPAEIDEVFQLNIYGIQRVNQAVIPFMRKQGHGRIIMISSLAAEAGLPFNGVYSASKAALDILTESLRMEVKQFGIEACVIQPGDFKTDVANHRKQPESISKSPYENQFNQINETTIANVAHAPEPIVVAKKISRLLKKKKLKPKYRVGSPIELIMPKVKTLLPTSWFEKLLMGYYKL